jgi:hypothetical protein
MTDDLFPLESDAHTAHAAAARPGRPRWAVPFACGVAGALLGAGVVGGAWAASGSESADAAAASTFMLDGKLSLALGEATDQNYVTCKAGAAGFSDIAAGTTVTVYDDSGKIVGSGILGPGVFATPGTQSACVFPIAVAKVPTGPRFYQIEVSHRGRLTVSAADAQAGRFSATLG